MGRTFIKSLFLLVALIGTTHGLSANDADNNWLAATRVTIKSTLDSGHRLAPATLLDQLDSNKEFRTALAFWKLGNICSPEKLDEFLQDSSSKDFGDWLQKNPEILETYLVSRPLVGKTRGAGALKAWAAIWKNDPESREGFWLKAAIGQTLATKAAADETDVKKALERYQFMKLCVKEKRYFPDFEELTPWEIRFVANTGKPISEVEWCQKFLVEKKPNFKIDNIGGSGYAIPYRLKNYRGVSVHKGKEYYDNKPVTFALQVEYGGVCGAISTLSSWFGVSKGIPAMTVGQPGHCALIWRVGPGKWKVGNNISGWPKSTSLSETFQWGNHPSQVFPFGEFQSNSQQALRSCLALWTSEYMAEQDMDAARRVAICESGLTASLYNYDLWRELANGLTAKKAQPDEWRRDAVILAKSWSKYPLQAPQLLEYFSPGFLASAKGRGISDWIGVVADAFSNQETPLPGRECVATGYANFLASQMRQVGLNARLANQVAQGTIGRDFWKKVPEDKRENVDTLFRSAIRAGVKNPTVSTSISKGYYVASLDDPKLTLLTKYFFNNLLTEARRKQQTSGALSIARMLILFAEDADDDEAVALNTFFALQIRLESAPKNDKLWRQLTPALIANAKTSGTVMGYTMEFLRQPGLKSDSYSKGIQKIALAIQQQLQPQTEKT
ncbi:MAG: hypothetical protein LBV12_04205 [Puniceicoccales bacterium]|jgi:hypothetical protein|nr:hypothetical protein [Puniceicoccales bacterium]